MTVTDQDFKNIMSKFPTGVNIVTTIDGNSNFHAVTISSFCSLSLHPHLVLFCLGKEASTHEAFTNGNNFAVNILSMHQFYLAEHFSNANNQDKWENIELLEEGTTKCPLINGVIGFIECKKHKIYDGGDHDIFIGEVINCRILSEAKPLLYYNSNYATFGNRILK